ncbi:MAG: hypothetical protein KF812_04370 [Fimbriimonadaceae bacterium]|nr:hypothetical protein [Fimbriimonadaceae bacterium]
MLTCAILLALNPTVTARFTLVEPNAKVVEIRGDLWGWDKGEALQKGRNGIWALEKDVPAAARVEYKFVVDGEWILNPRAPKSPNGLGGENSFWTGPNYRGTAIVDPSPLRQWGVSRTTMEDARGEKYEVVLARPAGVTPTAPVFIFNDGRGYETYVRALDQTANLVKEGKIPKCVIVLVESPNRTRDYWQEPAPYFAFINDRLLPWVRQSAGVIAATRDTGMGGASLGGLISLRAGREFPDRFGMVFAQSPSIWADENLTTSNGMSSYRARTALTWGSFERMEGQVQAWQAALGSRGRVLYLNERPEGHTWSLWREEFAPGLIRLLNNR